MDLQSTAQTANKVKHLCTVANTLTTSPTSTILKSYYFTKCRMLTLSGSVGLPQQFLKSTVRCPRCCVQYDDGPRSVKILANRKNRFVQRLLKRNASGKSLTRYQDKYLKDLMRKGDVDAHNTLVITCGVCQHKTKESLKKPEQLTTEAVEQTIRDEDVSKARKKKKKKDRFSGLDKNAVLAATPQNKAYHKKEFMQLETPPDPKMEGMNNLGHKKNLFSKNQRKNVDKRNSGVVKKKGKEKQRSLKGLSAILNDSTPSKKPSALKLFLTSI